MTRDEENSTKLVYIAFLENDYGRKWEDIDEKLWELEFLNDEETITEVEIQIHTHSDGIVKCSEEHKNGKCLVPELFESINAILGLWSETGYLNEKNRYILHNYLATSYMGLYMLINNKIVK